MREKYQEHFRPHLDWRKARFAWLGTDKPLHAFTFIFPRERARGPPGARLPFQHDPSLSTFIVECHEDTWRRGGLDQASEEDTVHYYEQLFADHLDGHPLLVNRSLWRAFPTVTNERWHHRNFVLIGDSAHTAHFSIGSGTKLAMEDAIALASTPSATHGTGMTYRACYAAYEEARRIDCLEDPEGGAARACEWFEDSCALPAPARRCSSRST